MIALLTAFCISLLLSTMTVAKGFERRFFLLASFLVLFFFLGFRSIEVGTDTQVYYQIYERLAVSGESRHEPLFKLVNLIAHDLGLGAEAVVLFFAAFCMLLFYLFIVRYSVSPLLSLSFFLGLAYYFYTFNIIRQGAALAVTCYAFGFILKRQHLRFIFATFIAAGFHYSALVFYPAYYLGRRYPITLWGLLWGVSLGGLFLFDPMDILITYIAPFVGDYYQGYFKAETGESSLSVRRLVLQVVFVLSLYVLHQQRKQRVFERKVIAIINIFMVGVIMGNFLASSGWLARISDYYDIFVILVVPILLNKLFEPRSRLLVTSFLVLVCFVFYLRFLSIGSHGVLPFSTWL